MSSNNEISQFSLKLVRTPGTGSSWGFNLMGGAGYKIDQNTRVPLMIQSVVANSIAARNGLAPGDSIMAIDGRASADATLEQAKMMLIRAGNEVNLVIRRDEALKKFLPTLSKKVKSTTQLPLSVSGGGGGGSSSSGGGSSSSERANRSNVTGARRPLSVSQAFPRRMAPSPPLPTLPQTTWTGEVPGEIAPTDSSVISNVGIVPFERSPAFNRLASGRSLPVQPTKQATQQDAPRPNQDTQQTFSTNYNQHLQQQTQAPQPISSEGQISRSFRALETDLAQAAAMGARPASIFDLKKQSQRR
ncbi:hypothetical protein ACOME3_010300 [Neoechinorhynchus agilis]